MLISKQSMQLNLFDDNRREILSNIANELVDAFDFGQAASLYGQILEEYPDDGQIVQLHDLAVQWSKNLFGPDARLNDPGALNCLWLQAAEMPQGTVRRAVLRVLAEATKEQPEPLRLYYPPRFHLGILLMEAGAYDEAFESLQSAISDQQLPIGRLCAWCGDLLTLSGSLEDAPGWYLAAFVKDPSSVDLEYIKSPTVRYLLESLRHEASDIIGEDDIAAWLPVWGWLKDYFALPLDEEISGSVLSEDLSLAPAKHWWLLLMLAEKARTVQRNDVVLITASHTMKKLNGFMFGLYLEKINCIF